MENALRNINTDDKPFLNTLRGEKLSIPPVWLMRQAGRYLAEYRELRKNAKSFLDLVYNPNLAAEITVQPIRRYQMDAAILFSDILVTPHAMGQKVAFVEKKGPVLDAISDKNHIDKLELSNADSVLSPIYETIRLTKKMLVEEGFNRTALIGFAGAPWTVACYMIEGGSSRDFIKVKSFAYTKPDLFSELVTKLESVTTDYLIKQIEAGVEAIQIFDSWSGLLNREHFKRWVEEPTSRIVDNIKQKYPDIPIIGFPKGAGTFYSEYAKNTNITALSLDPQINLEYILETVPKNIILQGNLDPIFLLNGGKPMINNIEKICSMFADRPFIFNLGHGVIKETPPENVALLVETIRKR
jgi:uroporphyrinogen decarboxylase